MSREKARQALEKHRQECMITCEETCLCWELEALLESEPPAGEWTKEKRKYYTPLPEELCDSPIETATQKACLDMQEACDRIDRLEAALAGCDKCRKQYEAEVKAKDEKIENLQGFLHVEPSCQDEQALKGDKP